VKITRVSDSDPSRPPRGDAGRGSGEDRRRGKRAKRRGGGLSGTLYLDQNLDRIAAAKVLSHAPPTEGASTPRVTARVFARGNGTAELAEGRARESERERERRSERSRHLLALVCHRPRVIS